jgi:hypothetical protein
MGMETEMKGPQCAYCYAASTEPDVDIYDHVRACKPVARRVSRQMRHQMFCSCQGCTAMRARLKQRAKGITAQGKASGL